MVSGRSKKRIRDHSSVQPMTSIHASLAGGFTANNQVTLIRGGHAYFATLLQMIERARESIYIRVYLFAEDSTGHQVADALKRAAQRNVAVYLLTDGYVSQGLSKHFIQQLRAAGVHFRFFEPLFKSRKFYFGRRLHEKVIVTDHQYTLVGGINIADRYNDINGIPAWLDFAILAEGEIAAQLCTHCWEGWQSLTLKRTKNFCSDDSVSLSIPPQNRSTLRMRRNDWVKRRNEISLAYIEMLRNAEQEITILCSYFLPGKIIRRSMLQARKRGVRIRVIAAGRSDVMIAKYAERWLYNWLLRAGVELYEYQDSILHGKLAVCDDVWMTLGSYNINNISAYASIELNLDVRDPAFTRRTRKELDQIIHDSCIAILPDEFVQKTTWLQQLVRWFSYQIIRTLLFLFTFHFTKEKP